MHGLLSLALAKNFKILLVVIKKCSDSLPDYYSNNSNKS